MQEIIKFINYHQILSIWWFILLVLVIYSIYIEKTSKVKIVTHDEMIRLINIENGIVIDSRKRIDFHKEHITGAINLLPIDIKNNNIGKLNKYKKYPVIVVDDTGMQAQESANFLNKIGFKRVFVLKHGILGWKSNNLPLINSNRKT